MPEVLEEVKVKVKSDPLYQALKTYFGFNQFRGNQEKIIRSILAGQDTFVIMPTGGGKSLCFQLPAMLMDGTAIIISPLISLMKNQVDQMSSLGLQANFLNSSLAKDEMTSIKKNLRDGKIKMLYVAPETLVKDELVDLLKNIKISFVAVDEAHCISEWGHDFRPEYRRIKTIISKIGRIPIMALTATATPKVQLDILRNLQMEKEQIYKSSFNRPNLYYEVRPKTDAMKQLIQFVKQHKGKSGIIYCLSRKRVEEVANILNVNGIKALPYHAGFESEVRTMHQDKFLNEDADVIVATIAFGMGIDKPDVRFVIHYDVPKSIEGYYQETGRGGRDGLEGKCLLFYNFADIVKLEKFMKNKPLSEREAGRELLYEMAAYCESSVCRRTQLLHYFGEYYEKEKCGYCDNCRNPKNPFEAEEFIKIFLQAIIQTEEKFGINHVVNIVSGSKNRLIKDYEHHKLPVYGAGSTIDAKTWQTIARQMLLQNFIRKDLDEYGTIAIEEKGKEFLKKSYPVTFYKDNQYEATDEPIGEIEDVKLFDEDLFEVLRKLRKQIADEKKLPPFVIFQDPSLEEMAAKYPITLQELAMINGAGQGKIKRYGQKFADAIKKYVEENEIEKQENIFVKTPVYKSASKVFIIQQIDRKTPLNEIARLQKISLEDLYRDVEQIINSGTRLNMEYYVKQNVDEDKVQDLYDYFMKAETDSIEAARNKLGEDFDWQEIQLVRMKFLSEVGN